jgi:hypothetical protein
MSIKSLIAAALIVGSSSAALANPVVSSVEPVRAFPASVEAGRTYPVINGEKTYPVLNGEHRPIIDPMPLTRPTLVGRESRIFKGTETFWVGANKGRFDTLKLESEGFKSFVTDLKIRFTDGRTQTVWLNEYVDSHNPCVTINLAGAHARSIQSIEFTGANARQSTLKLVAE